MIGNECEERPKEDDEGLKLDGYDLILLGTGLTMSIISAAAVKAGLAVLHMDRFLILIVVLRKFFTSISFLCRNEYYGGDLYNSYNSLSSFISHSTDPMIIAEPIQSVCLDFYVHPFLKDMQAKKKVNDDSLTTHPASFGYLMKKNSNAEPTSPDSHPCFLGFSQVSSAPLRQVLQGDREFNLEGCSKLVLCDESTIDLVFT